MQRLNSYRPFIKLTAALLFVSGLWIISICVQCVKWVGRTDLEVCFIVTDAETGQQIPNATIQVRAEAGGFCDDCERRKFTVAADGIGCAKHSCTNCMCFGSRSAFEETFVVHLPWWWFNAKATGYSDSEPEYLDLPGNIQRVQRGKPFATIVIPIRLHKDIGGTGLSTP